MNTSPHISKFFPNETHGLGEFTFAHPPRTFALTPASRILIRAICENQSRLHGIGLDWGCGVGCLAIVAARIQAVETVIGLDIAEQNIASAQKNARQNAVASKVQFILADSFQAVQATDQEILQSWHGKANFLLTNPPASDGDDGFGFRRKVLREAVPFLKAGGQVWLNVSAQYGVERITRLTTEVTGYRYAGMLCSSNWQAFDLHRPDLLACLQTYVAEELRGGMPYQFQPGGSQRPQLPINAQTAYAEYLQSGISPLSQWQTHLFEFVGSDSVVKVF
ncbi:MAG TPA: methyltransferase [Anaerolineales bacterium]|nr:methyltransferase [Anaerolineales bacterium]